jgi:hypothetical protein
MDGERTIAAKTRPRKRSAPEVAPAEMHTAAEVAPTATKMPTAEMAAAMAATMKMPSASVATASVTTPAMATPAAMTTAATFRGSIARG